jgi:hypothetical protein
VLSQHCNPNSAGRSLLLHNSSSDLSWQTTMSSWFSVGSKKHSRDTDQSSPRTADAAGFDTEAFEKHVNAKVDARLQEAADAYFEAFRTDFKQDVDQRVQAALAALQTDLNTKDDVIAQLQAKVASQDSRLAAQDSEVRALKAQQQARPAPAAATEMQADIADLKAQQEAQQRQANSKFLIVYGVQEQAGDPDPLRTVNNKLTAVGSRVQAAAAVRLGKEPTPDRPRPVKIEITDRQAVFSVAKRLRTGHNIQVKPCLTKQQQQTCRELQPEAKRLFEAGHFPFWRDARLLYKDKNTGRIAQFVPGAGAGAGASGPGRAVPDRRPPPRAPAPGSGSRATPATGANTTPMQGQATPASAASAAPASYAAATAPRSGSPATNSPGQQTMEA